MSILDSIVDSVVASIVLTFFKLPSKEPENEPDTPLSALVKFTLVPALPLNTKLPVIFGL